MAGAEVTGVRRARRRCATRRCALNSAAMVRRLRICAKIARQRAFPAFLASCLSTVALVKVGFPFTHSPFTVPILV